MTYTIQQIADALGCEARGDLSLKVASVSEPADAGPEDLALAMKPDYAGRLSDGQARAALLWDGADWESLGLAAAIFAPRPRMAMAGVTRMMDAGYGYGPGRHPTALIDPTADLAEDVTVGPYTIIGPGVRLGPGSTVGPQGYIGPDSTIGAGATLHVGARIGPRVRIGDKTF